MTKSKKELIKEVEELWKQQDRKNIQERAEALRFLRTASVKLINEFLAEEACNL